MDRGRGLQTMEKVALTVTGGRIAQKENGSGGVSREYLLELLQHHFGHSSFRGRQLEAIEAVLSGRDCFCLMPTGGGKSICYEIPALAKAGIVLVVSPLIALMENQVSSLKALKINAEYLCSTQTAKVKTKIYDQLNSGRPTLRLLYVTPELIATVGFISKLQKLHGRGLLSLIAIDEAHCISSWGHDFRPSYRQLSALRTRFPGIPMLALTATAAKRVQEDVIKSLCLDRPHVLISSFNRSNISYEVRYKDLLKNAYEDLLKLLRVSPEECCIVYCHSRATCDEIGARLLGDRISSTVYHAGLGDKKRSQALEDWVSGKIPVVVATVAFGMGIDRKDVRMVCHYNVPKSLEGFYQESGRAGRDGKPARSVIYYGMEDRQLMEFLASKPDTTRKHKHKEDVQNSLKKNMESISKMVQFCEEARCRRQMVLAHFGENVSAALCAKTCDVCKSPNRVSANLEDLALASSNRRGAYFHITSSTNSGRGHQDPSEFWDDVKSESEDDVSGSDEEDEATIEARAVVSKGGRSSLSQVERKVNALARAEEAFHAKQGSDVQVLAFQQKGGGVSDKKAITQAFRDAALNRLKVAVMQAYQRMTMTSVAADNTSTILESQVFKQYGKAGKTFYNSQLASTVRWLSTCSSSDLESRLGTTALKTGLENSTQANEASSPVGCPSPGQRALNDGGEPSLSSVGALSANMLSSVTTTTPSSLKGVLEEKHHLPPIPTFNDFMSKRKQLPFKTPLRRDPGAPFKKPRLL